MLRKAAKSLDPNESMGGSQKSGVNQGDRVDQEGTPPCHHAQGVCPNRGTGTSLLSLVPKAGLEPARLAPHAPQTCVSAISPLRRMRSLQRRGMRIIEVGQNPCQSIVGPVESGGLYSPDPPTLCRVTIASLPHFSMMSLNDGHRGPSLRCSTSTIHSYPERPAR